VKRSNTFLVQLNRRKEVQKECVMLSVKPAHVVGESHAKEVFAHMSSLVTDGASANTGEKGAWSLDDFGSHARRKHRK
jgi:hypothetical protein